MTSKTVNIAGASGYWGESAMATPQLLGAHMHGDIHLDYIVYDYLAEITMSILARAKAKNPDAGFATDFVRDVVTPHLHDIANSGITLIANAGGVNPEACGAAVRAAVKAAGLPLRVAVITGDNRMDDLEAVIASAPTDMFSGAPVPARDAVRSVNTYLGAFPVAKALAAGADIVITGRVVDSAVTLGALIHEFGWGEDDWDHLASGSLCGHILECGPQAGISPIGNWRAMCPISATPSPKSQPTAASSQPSHPRQAASSMSARSASKCSMKSETRRAIFCPM